MFVFFCRPFAIVGGVFGGLLLALIVAIVVGILCNKYTTKNAVRTIPTISAGERAYWTPGLCHIEDILFVHAIGVYKQQI